MQLDRAAREIVVGASTGNLAQQVDIAQQRNQRKIEAPRKRRGIPQERQPRRSPSLIGPVILKRRCQLGQILE